MEPALSKMLLTSVDLRPGPWLQGLGAWPQGPITKGPQKTIKDPYSTIWYIIVWYIIR